MKKLLQQLVGRASPPPVADPAPVDKLLAATGLRRITDVDPGDIFVAGYPKSGNTWLQELIAGLVFGLDLRVVPNSVVQELMPDVHATAYYLRHLTPTFFKTHELPRPEYRKVVYLARDGRDAMVSYFHHLAAMQGAQAPDFLTMVREGRGLLPCRWEEHVEAWLANPHGAEIITIKYEDLHRDTVGELERLCVFAGVRRERAALEAVVAAGAFEVMREKEKTVGWGERATWPKGEAFIRRGKVGSHADEMPREARELFLEQAGGAMRQLGYLF